MQILFLRGNTAQNDSYTGPLGSITIDTQAKRVRLHNGVTAGGFARLANLDDLLAIQSQIDVLGITDITGLTAALSALDSRIGTVETSYINKDGQTPFTGNQSMGGFLLTNLAQPVAGQDAATKQYVDDGLTTVQQAVAAMGNAFNYIGLLSGGIDEPNAFDLGTLAAADREPGDYYKVGTSGWFKLGAQTQYLNLNDGLVFNTAGGFDPVDNTNTEVQGTLNFVAVVGSTDTGFVVDLHPTFKTRVSDAETAITALQGQSSGVQSEIDATQTGAGLATNGAYVPNVGANYVDDATSLHDADQQLDTALKALSDTVSTLNTGVSSVIGSAPVQVNAGDPANPVISVALASELEAQQLLSAVTLMTPQRTRTAIETGDWTIDLGVLS